MWLYGPWGVGKTTLAASAQDSPWGADVLILDAEGGVRSIAHRTDIMVIRIQGWSDLLNVYLELAESNEYSYKTVVLDNMSEFNQVSIFHAYERDESSKKDPDTPALNMYQRSTNQMRKMIRAYRDLSYKRGLNVIFTSWESTEKDDTTGAISTNVALTPALEKQAGGMIDILAYMSVQANGVRSLQLEHINRIKTKFRRDPRAFDIPGRIEDPSLVPMLAVLKGGETWEKAFADYQRSKGIATIK